MKSGRYSQIVYTSCDHQTRPSGPVEPSRTKVPEILMSNVEQHLLDLQQSRSDRVVCLALKLMLQILET